VLLVRRPGDGELDSATGRLGGGSGPACSHRRHAGEPKVSCQKVTYAVLVFDWREVVEILVAGASDLPDFLL
jgi:hypothetical protein